MMGSKTLWSNYSIIILYFPLDLYLLSGSKAIIVVTIHWCSDIKLIADIIIVNLFCSLWCFILRDVLERGPILLA